MEIILHGYYIISLSAPSSNLFGPRKIENSVVYANCAQTIKKPKRVLGNCDCERIVCVFALCIRIRRSSIFRHCSRHLLHEIHKTLSIEHNALENKIIQIIMSICPCVTVLILSILLLYYLFTYYYFRSIIIDLSVSNRDLHSPCALYPSVQQHAHHESGR